MPTNPVQFIKQYLHKRRELDFFKQSSIEEIFTRIYENNKWGATDTRSGKGSSLDRTIQLRKRLPELLQQLHIDSLLDIPCGDFYWMQEIELPLQQYTGADIVAALVEQNTFNHAASIRCFLQLDLLRDSLPNSDAILCRECLVHLSFADIEQAIGNILTSGSTYLLTTHFPELPVNRDIVTGKHRPLNLRLPPFGWPPPFMEIVEDCTTAKHGKKCLSVWKIAELA